MPVSKWSFKLDENMDDRPKCKRGKKATFSKIFIYKCARGLSHSKECMELLRWTQKPKATHETYKDITTVWVFPGCVWIGLCWHKASKLWLHIDSSFTDLSCTWSEERLLGVAVWNVGIIIWKQSYHINRFHPCIFATLIMTKYVTDLSHVYCWHLVIIPSGL